LSKPLLGELKLSFKKKIAWCKIMFLHPQPNASPNHNTNNKIEIQLDTKSKHKPQAMFLAPCHMLHSLLTNKHVMIQGMQDLKRYDIQKKLISFKRG
jgi:hypothetical protein